mmetsp:Transcript_41244/g.98950  ORF Transcript_41244/g.98950 Transcript_41244/m.98950 type:complete len:224 (+) Transcript_41244:206-877(+)
MVSMRIAMTSACLPTSRDPILSARCKALAPLIVAIRSASWAGTALGSWEAPFARMAASFISAIMSTVLLDDCPSVPIATLTPWATSFATGQNPEANFKFDVGQWTIDTFFSATTLISSSVRQVMCTAINLSLTKPMRSKFWNGLSLCSLLWHASAVVSSFSLASHSTEVSWRCTWTGRPCSSLTCFTLSKVASVTVYGACGATVHPSSAWSFIASRDARPFAM